MCLLIFAHRVCPGYPLVLAANRDEFYNRETASSSFWVEQPDLLAGRDLRAGGTWMGITRRGQFAAITNYYDPSASGSAPRSRGELPLDFLTGQHSPLDYLNDVALRSGDYAGFSLLLGDTENLWYFSNRPLNSDGRPAPPQVLQPGIYGLSNANLNTPWPKIELGKQRLAKLLANCPLDHDDLLSLVNSRVRASAEDLNLQGMESEMEQVLSAQFILAGEYGTRSTTTLCIDDTGDVSWRELGFDRHGRVYETCEEEFRLSS